MIFAIALLATAVAPVVASPALGGNLTFGVGTISVLSSACPGRNAEAREAVDSKRGYVYEVWVGCGGIAFARSADGGRSFSAPIALPAGARAGVDDPGVAVGPDGAVHASFMVHSPQRSYPVVATSFDQGATFPQLASLIPARARNWGDADFIAVGPDGTVYVTWDYGPRRSSVRFVCTPGGSCSFTHGEFNVVIQKSTDGGRRFGPLSSVSPGFPAGGADSGPLVVEPSGRLDVLYQRYAVTNAAAYRLGPAYAYFTSSTDHGRSWSHPVPVGQRAGTMSTAEWWTDGDIAADAAGNLYAAGDTQGRSRTGALTDTGWLAFSADAGQHWSMPIQVPADRLGVPHITEVAGGPSGIAYVSWLFDSNRRGYAQYLRVFSIARGWLTPPIQISQAFGNPAIWPGDTFGIASWPPGNLILSWGSAVSAYGIQSQIFAAPVTIALP
jgi:hypothetical protein